MSDINGNVQALAPVEMCLRPLTEPAVLQRSC